VLDCFLRGLPYAYRSVVAPLGAIVQVEVTGDCGGVWQITRQPTCWAMKEPAGKWDARVVIPQELAWRVFTKGSLREGIQVDGPLARHVLDLTAIVA